MRALSLPAPDSCRGQSSEGPFPDQLSFEFRQSREEREDQLSAGRRRVDAGPLAGEYPDPDVPVVEVLHQVDEMAEIATEAIEPPEGVPTRFVSSAIADRGEFWWNPQRPDEPKRLSRQRDIV